MVRKLSVLMFVAVLFAALNASQRSVALAEGNPACTLAGVAGSYGFSYNGVAVLPSGTVPVAAAGRFSSDGAGNVVGTEINSLNGTAAFQTIKGTITLHSDCSTLLVASVYQGNMLVRTSVIHYQYENNGTEIQGIFRKVTLPDNSDLPVVITITGQRVND